MRKLSPCSLVLLFAAMGSHLAPAQEPARIGALPLRLLDENGRPLGPGAPVGVGVCFGPLRKEFESSAFVFNFGILDLPQVLALESEGRVLFPGARAWPDHSKTHHADLLVIARDAEGRRSRARCPWPVEPSIPRPLQLRLLGEQELFHLRLIDSLGAPVQANAVSLMAQIPGSKHETILTYRGGATQDEPIADRGSENEIGISGWPVKGDWKLSASYLHHGPHAAPVSVASGTRTVELVLPATGHVQIRTKLPQPFSIDALKVAYHHVESGAIARCMVLDGAANHRLLVGVHALSLELYGEPLLDLGRVEVPHARTFELPVAMPPELRSFRLFVKDSEGRELHRARARPASASGRAWFHRDGGPPWGVLVATVRPKLDLLVECEGYRAELLQDVTGEREVRLQRQPR